MTDLQVMTMALSIVIPLSMLIYSNSRITDTRVALQNSLNDLKEMLRAELGTLRVEIGGVRTDLGGDIRSIRAELGADIKAMRAEMQAGFREAKQDLKIHELEHHK